MNSLKTLIYMGGMHGFFTYAIPFLLASFSTRNFDSGILKFASPLLWLAGTLIIIRCSVDFVRKGRGTPAHLDPPQKLVITGLYRYARNPIYTGAMFILLSYVIWFGSLILVLYFLFFVLAYHILVLIFEEPVLKSKFGGEYIAYMKEVPRWLPGKRMKDEGGRINGE